MSVLNLDKVPVGRAMNYRCPVEGCPEKKPEVWHLVCPKHWGKVPQALREKVWHLFKTENGSLEHRTTCALIVAELEVKEGRRAKR